MVKDVYINIMFVMVGQTVLMVVMNGIGTAVCTDMILFKL